MITPIEIQNKVFKSGGLGYDKKDVDSFMEELLENYETLYRERMEMTDRMNTLKEGIQYYKTIEKTLQKALLLAERTAEETKSNAMKNAALIEQEAVSKANIILYFDISLSSYQRFYYILCYSTNYRNTNRITNLFINLLFILLR